MPLLLRSNFLLFETIEQPFDIIKIQNGGARVLKSENRRYSYPFFCTLKLSFHLLKKESEIDFISNNFTSICYKSGRSLYFTE